MKQFEKNSIGIIVLTLVLLCYGRPAEAVPPPERMMRPMMGTLVEILWRGPQASSRYGQVEHVMDHMASLAAALSLKNTASDVAAVNAAAGQKAVPVSEAFIEVVTKSLEISQLTDGAFDITVGALETAWGDIQWDQGGRLPQHHEIQSALSKVGYKQIAVNHQERTIFLKSKGIRLDLGGIAKGYIIESGLQALKRIGLENVLINAGGDIGALGRKNDPPWRIGLQDPFEKGRLLGVFFINTGTVVTSGSYERFYQTPEGTFTHIFNPSTGRPVKEIISVTILADDAAFADGLATALMVKSREAGTALLSRLEHIQGVIIEKDGTMWIEETLKGQLQLEPLHPRNRVHYF